MAEAIANSVEDHLIEGLSFKLRPGASYVTDRRFVTFFPSGSNTYSPIGAKVIKIVLADSNWMDPTTIKFMYKLTNKDGAAAHLLKPLGGPHVFFRRARLICGGVVVEDIDYYNRVHQMFDTLLPAEKRLNDQIEGFGNFAHEINDADNTLGFSDNDYLGGYVKGGDARWCMFTPLFGVFHQDKYLPLRYCPITIELEIVNSYTDPIVSVNGAQPDGAPTTPDNTSMQWEISVVQVKCDVVTLDNALDNEYAQHLLSGKSLPINFSSYVSQVQIVPNGDFMPKINIARSLTRLKSVFITLFRDSAADPVKAGAMSNYGGDTTMYKECNFFYHPAFGYNYEIAIEPEFIMSLGAKLFPEYPIRSSAEFFYQLKKAIGTHHSATHTVNILPKNYRFNKFIIGIDCEKILQASFTGFNTKNNELLRIDFRKLGVDNNTSAHRIYTVLHTNKILTIRDTGVELYD